MQGHSLHQKAALIAFPAVLSRFCSECVCRKTCTPEIISEMTPGYNQSSFTYREAWMCVFKCVRLPAGTCEMRCLYCLYTGCYHMWCATHEGPTASFCHHNEKQGADSWLDPPPLSSFSLFFIHITFTATKQSSWLPFCWLVTSLSNGG